jgi:hypothetical protein
VAEPVVDAAVDCPYHEEPGSGCVAQPQLDGDWKFYEGACGSAFGWVRIAEPEPDACQIGLPLAVQARPPGPVLLTIGRRPE